MFLAIKNAMFSQFFFPCFWVGEIECHLKSSPLAALIIALHFAAYTWGER